MTSPSENQASGEVNKESVGTGAKQQSTDIPAVINRKKKHTQQLKKKKIRKIGRKRKGNPRQDNAPQEHAEGGDGGVDAGVGVGLGGVSAKLDDDRLPRNAGGSGA